MDGNKDEALRCMRIAEEAIAKGNKERAVKFIRISHRLNPNLPVASLLDACEKMGSPRAPVDENSVNTTMSAHGSSSSLEDWHCERSFTEEHVELIAKVRKSQDYYAILGVEKTCSVEEIRKAYKKLSLKVHPDKNKAPGSEDAFKKVSIAFKCLSDSNSRRQYDQTGLVEGFEHNMHQTVRRRRRPGHEFHEDDFDAHEIFRAFFGKGDFFRHSPTHRTTRRAGTPINRTAKPNSSGFSFNYMIILQIIPFLIIFLLAYLPFTEPEYSFVKNFSYKFSKTTEHGVEFFVKSAKFESYYPPGSDARANFENNVITDYKKMLLRYCHVEMQRRQFNKLPTPNCDKLHNLGVAY